MFLQTQHFCFPDLGKEKLCSILVFGNACFNIIVRINHDNVASRGAVGRTHTIVRLQTRIRRKDGTENFGGFVYVLDLYNGILCCGFLCARLISVSLFRLPRQGLPRPTDTPRGIYAQGYHALTTTARLSRLCIYPGYHAIVKFHSWVITPELSRSTTHVNRVITPAIVRSS